VRVKSHITAQSYRCPTVSAIASTRSKLPDDVIVKPAIAHRRAA
jgi:hypothetical protein